jgi:flavodoxin
VTNVKKLLSMIRMLVALAFAFAAIGCSAGAAPETGTKATAELPVSQEAEPTMPDEPAAINEELTEEPEDGQTSLPEANSPGDVGEGKALVAYFSRTGNTQKVALEVQSKTGGELWEMVADVPYSEDYQECVALARQELADDARPAISGQAPSLDGIDIVYLGFPIWCGDTPMIVKTFLESSDFSGKTIAPFSTSGSSGIGTAQASIKLLCPGANVLDGLSINSSDLGDYERLVSEWLDASK